MSAQITPGPWKIGKRCNLVASERGNVADCLFTHSKSDFRNLPTADECMANAKAIACIPEFLDYLHLRAAKGDETAALLLLKAGQ